MMRNFTASLLASLLLVQALPANAAEAAADSGAWYGLDWTLQDHVLTISGNNEVYSAYDGWGTSTELPGWDVYSDEIYEIVFQEGVTGIQDKVFEDYPQLRRVTLPSTLTHLYPYAFYGDEALTEITGLEYVTEFDFRCLSETAYIAEHPFVITEGKLWYAECTEFAVPEGVTEIMPFAFGNLTDTIFLPSSDEETVIAPIEITLPEGVTTIHDKAFAFCAGLTAVHLPDSLCKIGNYAFFDCANLGDIILGENVEHIGDQAFFNCRGLENLTVKNPDAVLGANAYGQVYNWNAALEEKRDNYTDEEYADALAALAAHPTLYDEAMASFAVHFFNTSSYRDIDFQNSLENLSAKLVGNGAIIGHTGSTAQSFADENNVTFYSINPLPGDVIPDNCVDILDVIMINKFLLGVAELNERAILAADYNQDGAVDDRDALGTLRHVIKLE